MRKGASRWAQHVHVALVELAGDLREHIEITESVWDLGTALLGRLVRHRQRGSDLGFEDYEFDIGDET